MTIVASADGPRIASLVPSLTETLVALGLRPWLIARTGFCIHPAEALAGVAKVGGTKDVNLPKLRRLRPTHVFVNVDENRHDTALALQAWPDPPEVIVTHPLGPDDNLALVDAIAARFGQLPEVAERATLLRDRLLTQLAATRPDGQSAARVLYLIWREPWMTVARDTYLSRMLARIGWRTWPEVEGGASGAARYPVVQGDESWLAGIEQVLLSSEPYRFGTEHVDAARRLCPNARVRLVDGELLSWYGARAVDGLAYLRELRELREVPDSAPEVPAGECRA